MKSASLISLLALSLAGCYGPHPEDRSFKCSAEAGSICPAGLTCDLASGYCVKAAAGIDAGARDLALPFDASLEQPGPRSCDDRVKAGAFSGLTNLTALNTAGDESSIALSSDGKRLYYLEAGVLKTATLSSPKTASAPSVVTIANGPATYNGGSLATGGKLWFSGTTGTTTLLYEAATTDPLNLAAVAHTYPTSTTCPFLDVALTDGDATKDLYVSFPLAGCSEKAMIAQGKVDKKIGAFYGALDTRSVRSPSVLSGGLTLLLAMASGSATRLQYAERPSTDVQWAGPNPVPLSSLGAASTRDLQAIVAPDCRTIYLVAERAGGKGGLDLWAADIAAQ
jgi:hypothetical protein